MANPFNFPFQPAPDDSTMSSIKAFGAPQGNRMPLPPAMPAPKAVESFDLRQSFGPSRSMVTGDRSLTRNPGGMAGLPLAPTGQLSPMGDRIGSRGMTPERRMEMLNRRAYTQGDTKTLMQTTGALLNIAQQQQGMNYGRERDATNFQQGLQMYGMQQQDQAARDQAQRGYQLEDWQRQQDAMNQRDATNFNQTLTLEGLRTSEQAMRDERARLEREQERVTGFEMLPGPNGMMLPGLRTQGGDFKQIGGGPLMPPAPAPTYEMRQDATGAYRQFYDGKPLPGEPTYSGQVQPGSYVRQATQGQPAPMQYTPNLPQPVERVTIGPDGQETRTLTRPQGSAPAAPPPAANALPGVKTSVGNQFRRADSASTQTGQMPNEAYAAPLSPEQMLDEARSEYARTGNDATLKQYFAQYPSEAVRLNQQEQQIWGQVAGQVDRLGRAASNRVDAQDARNSYIDRFAATPFTQGAINAEFEQNYPGAMRAINGSLPMPDLNLIGNANDLSRRAAAAAGRTMPAMPQRAPLQPIPPPLPMMIAEKNPQGFVARLNQLPTLPAFLRPTIRR